MPDSYTHATIPCAVLDVRAHAPSDEQIRSAPDIWDVYLMLARKAQIHLEMLMEMMAEEERQQEQKR